MDSGELVEGGAKGIRSIVDALEAAGVSVVGAYLIRTTASDGFQDTSLRIVTDHDHHDVLYKYVSLRRDGRFPPISSEVTMTPLYPSNGEARKIFSYSREIGGSAVAIHGVFWQGLYIEDAVVVKYPASEKAVA